MLGLERGIVPEIVARLWGAERGRDNTDLEKKTLTWLVA